jgi:hypothetical protein
MKRLLMLLGLLLTDVSTLIASDDASRSMLQNVATGIHQIRLPDGKSLFGDTTAVMEAGCFDLNHLNDDSIAASNAFAEFKKILRNPIKTHGWVRTEYYTPAEPLKYFQKIIERANHWDECSLQLIWHFLEDGNIHGVQLPGLTPQPERAALFKEIFDWRAGMRPNADHALEAIRLERERLELEAIAAEEEAKRKAEEAARIAAIAAAESAKPEFARKASDTGVRRRYVLRTQNTGDDDRATVKDPLILRHPRSHY